MFSLNANVSRSGHYCLVMDIVLSDFDVPEGNRLIYLHNPDSPPL